MLTDGLIAIGVRMMAEILVMGAISRGKSTGKEKGLKKIELWGILNLNGGRKK